MNIVLFIFQILGIILLFMLFLVLFVLIMPLCYQIEGDVHETKWVKAKISWLLHLIRAKVSYEDELLYGEICVFWKKITFSYEFTKSEVEEESSKETKKNIKDDAREKQKSKDKESFITKIKNIIHKFKDIYPRLKQIITDDRNKLAVVHLKKELFYLLKVLLPKKSRLNASFSTGSPDTTGQLCGVIACFPVIYQKNWTLRPDFVIDDPFFYGDFWGKGRFNAFQLLGILLRIIFDKNCRRMYTMIERLIKRIKKKTSQEDK